MPSIMLTDEQIAKQVAQYQRAVHLRLDDWVPACSGRELPTEIDSKVYQYSFNPHLNRHAYYCLTDDLVLIDGMEEYLPKCLR